VLPYTLDFRAIVSDDYKGDSFILEKLICIFDDGDKFVVVNTPQSGSFSKNESLSKHRSCKGLSIILPDAVKKRGAFDIEFKGQFVESKKIIEDTLRMRYSRNVNIWPGWLMVGL